jgi:hypothetical protein
MLRARNEARVIHEQVGALRELMTRLFETTNGEIAEQNSRELKQQFDWLNPKANGGGHFNLGYDALP